MAFIYRKEEKVRADEQMNIIPEPKTTVVANIYFLFQLVLILVCQLGKPTSDDTNSFWHFIWENKWYITGVFSLVLATALIFILKMKTWKVVAAVVVTAISTFIFRNPVISMVIGIAAVAFLGLTDKADDEENKKWILSSWEFTKQIVPLLAIGVVIAGFLLVPRTIRGYSRNNSERMDCLGCGRKLIQIEFSFLRCGCVMYFATPYKVPIIQGLIAPNGERSGIGTVTFRPSMSFQIYCYPWNYWNTENSCLCCVSHYFVNPIRINFWKFIIKQSLNQISSYV